MNGNPLSPASDVHAIGVYSNLYLPGGKSVIPEFFLALPLKELFPEKTVS